MDAFRYCHGSPAQSKGLKLQLHRLHTSCIFRDHFHMWLVPGVLVVKFNFSSRHGLVKILEPILMIPELIPGNWFWRSAVFSDSYASFNHFLETCTPSRPPGLSLEYFDTIFCIVYQQTFTGEHSLNVLNSTLPIYSIYRTSNERSNSYSDDFLKKFQNQIRFEIQKLY